MSRMTALRKNARLMVEACRKNGAVARAANAEVRGAMHALAAMGDPAQIAKRFRCDGVAVLAAEEGRRAEARKALLAALAPAA